MLGIFLKRGIPALCIFDEAAVTGSSGVCVDLEAWFFLIHLVGRLLDCVWVSVDEQFDEVIFIEIPDEVIEFGHGI
jgi:hypothetical protein